MHIYMHSLIYSGTAAPFGIGLSLLIYQICDLIVGL